MLTNGYSRCETFGSSLVNIMFLIYSVEDVGSLRGQGWCRELKVVKWCLYGHFGAHPDYWVLLFSIDRQLNYK